MPRYVILRHELPNDSVRASHWDLMLEWGGVLRTWALAELPREAAWIRADQLPDHRLAYLDYEGPISGDRGEVYRCEAGEYQLVAESNDELRARLVLAERKVELQLARITGAIWQARFESPSSENGTASSRF